MWTHGAPLPVRGALRRLHACREAAPRHAIWRIADEPIWREIDVDGETYYWTVYPWGDGPWIGNMLLVQS